ncbi:hypothetical protein [Streptomyces caelestis]|uniref:Uncharacterized protein n=1 Tax=Streptomyces caelestis TaxID=36816 RepID=A0A7W9H8D5_9ACTN|nr:hypothetical protein [Streptomyces caelestis]MBB5797226.1 hypothetical protein [Streptomyces caelestis]GGW36651.1 hypothetical protein GCM10010320_15170 [Streptomyces caelestis]
MPYGSRGGIRTYAHRPVYDDRGATGTEYLGMVAVSAAIVHGLDSTDTTFAIRVDAQQGSLSDGDLDRIIDSVEVH